MINMEFLLFWYFILYNQQFNIFLVIFIHFSLEGIIPLLQKAVV